MSWRVVIRTGPRVERARAASLHEVLELVEQRARRAAMAPRSEAVDLRLRRFAPSELVAARLELRGPQRLVPDVQAGVDVRGDGSVIAWTGTRRREALTPAEGETPYDALRRAVGADEPT